MRAPRNSENAGESSEGGSQFAFAFGGGVFTDPAELAAAFTERWGDAVELLEDPAGPSVELLRRFVEQVGEPSARYEVLARLESSDPVNVRLLGVLRHLAPGAEPAYCGGPLGPDSLWNLTRYALRLRNRVDEAAYDWAMEIIEYGVLTMFEAAPGGAELAEIESRRRRAEQRWRDVRLRLTADRPALAEALADDELLPVELLNIAVDESRAAQRLNRALTAGLRGMPAPPPWFERQVREAGGDPLRALAALRCVPQARDESSPREAWANEPPELRSVRRPRGGDERTATDTPVQVAGRPGAVLWAAAGMGLVTVLWWLFLTVLLLPEGRREDVATMVWGACLIQWAAECALALALALGRAYHPGHALLPRVVRFVLAPLESTRPRGLARTVILCAIVVVLLSWAAGGLPYLVPGAVCVLHVLWAYLRWADYAKP